MDDVDVDADRTADLRGEIVDRRLDAGPDVEDLALGPWSDRRQQRRVDGVVDVGVVARLLAVAVDLERLAVDRRGEELGDDAAVRVVGPLADAEDVRVADDRHRHPVVLVERIAVELAAQLAHRVR